jgi:endonuclease-3
MNKKEKIKKISEILDSLYPSPAIPLQHQDRYTLLIAVLLSAQCTDKRVNLITPQLFAKAKTPQEMIQLSVTEIEEIIRPCGLAPRKARAIWELSKLIIERHGGHVPNTFEELEMFPGVGHKTASVVMSQGFNQPAFPVDTHIHRCAQRWGLSSGKNVVQTEADLKRAFPKKTWNKIHLQIIYFAREYCPARLHNIKACPICSWIHED